MAKERVFTYRNTGTVESPVWEKWFQKTVADAVLMSDSDSEEKNIVDYIDEKIADLIGGAPGAYDTLKEIADYIADHAEVAEALNTAITNKANKDHGHNNATQSSSGFMSGADKEKLDGVDTGANNYVHPSTSGNKHIPSGGSSGQILRWDSDGTAVWGEDKDTTYSPFNGAEAGSAGNAGLVPAPAAGDQEKYLKADGTWGEPQNTTYGEATSGKSGLMSAEDKEKLDGLDDQLAGKVPTSRKVNSKSLSADITLNASDVEAIPTSQKGAAGGVAELDETGKVPSSQLPSYVDDVLEFDNQAVFPEAGEAGKIYVAKDTNKTYRWTGTAYVEISSSIALGETSSTAYRGDRGKAAYEHSQAAHAPSNAEANVQSDWNVTDTGSDAYIKNKPTSLPANGGNSATVNGHTVASNVPANAKFTDTVYTHPTTHAANMITQDATHRFVSDSEKSAWNAKANIYFASELPASAPVGSVCFLID